MKYIIAVFFFIVTWNHYIVVPIKNKPGPNPLILTLDYIYAVKKTTATISLETQEDVDRFIGTKGYTDLSGSSYAYVLPTSGIISPNAFNIKVEEKK